jgi:hypothetical protein
LWYTQDCFNQVDRIRIRCKGFIATAEGKRTIFDAFSPRLEAARKGHRTFTARGYLDLLEFKPKLFQSANLHSNAKFLPNDPASNNGTDAAEDSSAPQIRYTDGAAADRSRRAFDTASWRARVSSRLEAPANWIPAAPPPPPPPLPSASRPRDIAASASAAEAATLAAEITSGRPLDAATWDRVLLSPDPTECLRAIARRSLVCRPDGTPAEPALEWLAGMINVRCVPPASPVPV